MKLIIASLLIIVSFSASAEEVLLPTGATFETDLKQPKLIDVVAGYALLSGRHCIQCDENTSIYLHKISNEKFVRPATNERHTYPGELRDYMSGEVVQRTRMLYGNCHDTGSSVFWFVEHLTESGWVKSEYAIYLNSPKPEHVLSKNSQPNKEAALVYLEKGICAELPGIAGTTEP